MKQATIGSARRMPLNRGLTRELVVKAAQEMLDNDGLELFSSRRLGVVLGINQKSLYHYFTSMSELLMAVVELLARELVSPNPEDPDWKGQLTLWGRGVWQFAQRHPKAVPLMFQAGSDHPSQGEKVEALLGLWQRHTQTKEEAIHGFLTFRAFITGWSLWEVEGRGKLRPAMDANQSMRAFEFALDAVLNGLESKVRSPASRTQSPTGPEQAT